MLQTRSLDRSANGRIRRGEQSPICFRHDDQERSHNSRKGFGLLRAPDYRPRDRNEIARELGLKGRERVSVRKTLRELENGGEIVRIRKNRYVLPSEADLVTGKLSIHQAGYGFLVPEKAGEPDVFIAAENTGTAMNGDRVVARINRDVLQRRAKDRAGQASRNRSEGRVIRILERARHTI